MHWLIDPIKYHYADFNGRATRQEFWMFYLYYSVFYCVVILVEMILNQIGLSALSALLGVCTLLAALAIVVPAFALTVRRFHDIGRSAWSLFFMLIPIIGGFILLVFYCLPSQLGSNKYGSSKYELTSDTFV